MKPPSPYEYRVDIDRDGFFLRDDVGEVEPTRYTTWLAAAARLREIVDEDRAAKWQSSPVDDLHDDYE